MTTISNTSVPASKSPRRIPYFSHALLIFLSFLAVFPIYWMIITSLRPAGEIYSPSPIPSEITLEHYVRAWTAIPLGRMMLNTVVTAISQTAFQLVTSILAAYAFAAWSFRGRSILYALLALT